MLPHLCRRAQCNFDDVMHDSKVRKLQGVAATIVAMTLSCIIGTWFACCRKSCGTCSQRIIAFMGFLCLGADAFLIAAVMLPHVEEVKEQIVLTPFGVVEGGEASFALYYTAAAATCHGIVLNLYCIMPNRVDLDDFLDG